MSLRHLPVNVGCVAKPLAAAVFLAAGLSTVLCAQSEPAARATDTRSAIQSSRADGWLSVWAAAPHQPRKPAEAPTFNRQSLRQVVPVGIGGDRVRIRLSNVYGKRTLIVGEASIALQQHLSSVQPETLTALSFAGRSTVHIPAGALVVSDPVAFELPDGASLAVSLYLPDQSPTTSYHWRAFQNTFITPGNTTRRARVDVDDSYRSWFWLTGVEVHSETQSQAIVVLGDSITDGYGLDVGLNQTWPDVLQRRLLATNRTELRHSVLNLGIGGNRLLNKMTGFGSSLTDRFDRDAVDRPGTRYVIVQIGINDIGLPVTPDHILKLPESVRAEIVHANDLIAGFEQVIERAKHHGLTLIATTIPPYRGSAYYDAAGERTRQTVNEWIRSSEKFNAVIDFDAILRDTDDPSRLARRFDSGDHLHPNADGLEALADNINLELFVQATRFQ